MVYPQGTYALVLTPAVINGLIIYNWIFERLFVLYDYHTQHYNTNNHAIGLNGEEDYVQLNCEKSVKWLRTGILIRVGWEPSVFIPRNIHKQNDLAWNRAEGTKQRSISQTKCYNKKARTKRRKKRVWKWVLKLHLKPDCFHSCTWQVCYCWNRFVTSNTICSGCWYNAIAALLHLIVRRGAPASSRVICLSCLN